MFSGLITLILESCFEMEGGGISLILVLTIPFFIVLAIVFGGIYYKMIKPTTSRYISITILICFYLFLIGGALWLFPFK